MRKGDDTLLVVLLAVALLAPAAPPPSSPSAPGPSKPAPAAATVEGEPAGPVAHELELEPLEPPPAAAPPPVAREAYVYRVEANEGPSIAIGSGVLTETPGGRRVVLTNWHVARAARGPLRVGKPGRPMAAGRVVSSSEPWDLAAIECPGLEGQAVKLAAARPAVGERLTIAGFGGSEEYREDSGPARQYLSPGGRYPFDIVELAARARQGDSGGPIFNARDELAGVLFGNTLEGRPAVAGSSVPQLVAFLETVDAASSSSKAAGNATGAKGSGSPAACSNGKCRKP